MRNNIIFLTVIFTLLSSSASATDYNFTNNYGDTFYGGSSEFIASSSTVEFTNNSEQIPNYNDTQSEQQLPDNYDSDYDSEAVPTPPDVWGNESIINYNKFTMPDGLIDSSGKLGTLIIPKIGLNVTVYEEESLESMKRGAGHFKSTSCWDGNVGMAGHNRGTNAYFGRIKELSEGDEIIYKTKLGERIYKVKKVLKISETDWSYLQRTQNNQIVLITCVENVPNLRFCVVATE